MKKILVLALVAGLVIFVACGPSKEDQERIASKEKAKQDSIFAIKKAKQDSINVIDSLAQASLKEDAYKKYGSSFDTKKEFDTWYLNKINQAALDKINTPNNKFWETLFPDAPQTVSVIGK